MSSYNTLRESKGRNRQYDTMELEGDKKLYDGKQIYTSRQMACAVGTAMVILVCVFLLIWFLAPNHGCDVPSKLPPLVDEFPWQNEELPDFAYPTHYSLFIDADLIQLQFLGDVNITFKILEDTDFIVLNSESLNITRLTLSTKGNVESYQHSASRQQLYLRFDRILEKSESYTIRITYIGNLQRNMEGIYVTSYLHPQGMERRVIATHFANKHAREAFPCFDEPRFKSTFELSLAHSFDYDPISNTDIRETTPNDKRVTSAFELTQNMSTHSLAFLVSDFRFQKRDYLGVSVRVFTPTQFYAEGSFATETCIKILEYYNSLKFPLTFHNLDISYVPNSGYSGSSGLNIIFMKPSDILWNKDKSNFTKDIVVSSIAHQINSQYFGNQVSMKFWEESWFMEGISTYFEHLVKGHILKEEIRGFQVDITRFALRLGSSSHSVPLNVDVRRQSETTNAFDKAAYYKGAALVWMLDNYVGSYILQNSLLNVLEEYEEGSVSFSDIWRTIDEQINSSFPINVSTLMKSWIENRGYPLVTIIHRGDQLFINQQPFSSNKSEKNDVIWDIPFTLKTDSTLEYHVLRQRNDSLNISKEAAWFKANVNQTGFYRVNYDEPTWKSLSGLLQNSPQLLSSFDRSGLIDDALTLARDGRLDIEIAFSLLHYLEKEKDYEPWETALYHFHEISMVMQDNEALPLLQDYVRSLLKPILKTVDWSKEGSLVEANIPTTVLGAALENNNLDVVEHVRHMFNDWMREGHSIPPNLREIVYWGGVKYGEGEEWEFCWKKYQNEVDPREKIMLLLALGKSRYPWFQRRYLHNSLNETMVSIEDIPLVISSVANNILGGFVAWEFIQEHWPYLQEMFEKNGIFLKAILTKATAYFSTEFMYHQVKTFLEETEQDTEIAKQCLETILSNIEWKNETETKFVDWLNQRKEIRMN